MEYKITRVHRGGRLWFAATVRGIYLERASEAELIEAIKYREGIAKIFADPVDNES